MPLKRNEIILTCDVDGTLVDAPAPVPQRNVQAIRRFCENGGRFAIASGRSPASVGRYLSLFPVTAPCIVFNGGGIYDFQAKKMLYSVCLPKSFVGYLAAIIGKFPELGVVLGRPEQYISVSSIYYSQKYLGKEHIPFTPQTLDQLEGDFYKVIMSMEAEMLPMVREFALSQGWEDVHITQSSPNFLEIVPKDANKGTGLLALSHITGVPVSHMVSIGDYYNDLEMLQLTGFPVTVGNAPDDIKKICKLIVGNCMDGGVADLIEYLEAHLEA